MNILLQADSLVSHGLYFKAVFNWWDIAVPLLVFIVWLILHLKGRQGEDPLPVVSSWINLVAIKLRFQVSQSTNHEPPIIIDSILLKLKDKKYNVIDVTDSSVKFKERPWVIMSNFRATMRLDGGRFEIGVSDNGMLVSLHYYYNLLTILLALTILEIFTISDGVYEGSIFFALFFFISSIIQIVISKGVAKRMLSEIVNVKVVD
jgi:hypothetical protein